MSRVLIAALYHFTPLPDFRELKEDYYKKCFHHQVRGTLLLAEEGINGTIAGPEEGVRGVLAHLQSDPRFEDLRHKESWADSQPFVHLKVRLKKEIVSLGVLGVDPTERVGTYVKPKDWNTLISQPDVVLIDARNVYETQLGAFQGAVDPNTDSFREFPDWIKEQKDLTPETPVAMYCTGGIRCEKASSYMLQEGFKEVYHLEGGILKYLEEVPEEDSLWDGECYVFDRRVSVDHQLKSGRYDLCRACGYPIDEQGKADPNYSEGVSCAWCYDKTTEERKQRFAERHKQIALATARNEDHFAHRPPREPKMDPSIPLPVLYTFRRCPYAMRARLALWAAEIPLELREVVLRDKPPSLLEHSPKATVPVLILEDGTVMDESMDIMFWALGQQDLAGWLAPQNGSLEEARELIEVNDGEFKHHLDRYKYPDRYEGADGLFHRKEAEKFLKNLDERIQAHGYLMGSEPCIADFAIGPFIRQFANTDRKWFDTTDYHGLKNWLEWFLTLHLFQSIMEKTPQWHEGNDRTVSTQY